MSIVESFIEVSLDSPEAFLKVKETLTRIGIPSKRANVLTQSTHILHKQGRYYIVHFKQMFLLDGKVADVTDDDKSRLNTIVKLLSDWGLLKVVGNNLIDDVKPNMSSIKVIPFKEKNEWTLISKYSIGNK